MNKKLRYGLLTLLAFVGLAVNAQTTFDIDKDYATIFPDITGLSSNSSGDGDITKDINSIVKDGFTITVSAGEEGAKNPNRLWANTYRLRMYSGTLTVSGPGINNIEFIGKGDPNMETKTGVLKGSVWTGSANVVVFTVLGNTQISQIVINGDATPPDVTEEDLYHGTEDDPISVSEAIYAAEIVGNANSKEDFYVYGTISSIEVDKDNNKPYTYSYKGNATYFITDGNGNEFKIYIGNYFSGKNWAVGMADIEEGLSVVVCGKIVNFGGHTPEFANGKSYLVLLNGKGYEEPVIPIEEVTIAEFNTAEESTDVLYKLTGRVRNLRADDQNGRFDLEDATGYVYVYGLLSEKGGEAKKFQDLVTAEGIKEGSYLTLIGLRSSHEGKIEVKDAYFVSAEAGEDPITFEMSVAESLEAADDLFVNLMSYDYYEVTGYVVDTPNYYNGTEDAFTGGVDLHIADTKGGEPTLFIYHAWGPNDVKFTEDGDLDLFAKGDKVVFRGKLQKYIDNEDNEVLELKNGYLVKVINVVAVNVPSSGYATLCPPHPILIEDQEVFIVKQVSGSKAILQQLESGTVVPSGVGLIVKGSGMVEFNIADEAGTAPEGNLLVGALKDKELSDSEAFILVGGKFYLCYAGTFPGGKAYLPATVISSGAKIIVFGDETTGINEMNAQDSTNEIYTIGGIRVKNAQQKGIYIINGKKVVK